MPGVRLNLGSRSASVSLGVRGASYTIGTGRRTATVGIPGTGLSFSKSASTAPRARSERGAVAFLLEWLDEQARVLNGIHEALADTHARTPPPYPHLPLEVEPFDKPAPLPPAAPRRRWTHAFLPGRWRALVAAHQRSMDAHQAALKAWNERRERSEEAAAGLIAILAAAAAGDPRAMEELFERVLARMDWPRETVVSFEVDGSNQRLALDIDLPEIEDLPSAERRVLKGELRVASKPLSETECRRRYARHAHGVVFRAIGEAFARLPTVQRVAAAGYSQRADKATGQVRDEYLLRIEVDRASWSAIDFSALDRVDPVEALQLLGVERLMSKTGMFRPIGEV